MGMQFHDGWSNTGGFPTNWRFSNTGTSTIVDPTAIAGAPSGRSKVSHYARFTANSGQSRCEVEHAADWCKSREGHDRYHGWSFRMSSPIATGAWQIWAQWHSNVNNGDAWDTASPLVGVYAGSSNNGMSQSRWYLGGGTNNPAGIGWWQADLGLLPATNVWHDLVIRLKTSTSSASSLAQVWLNGTQIVNVAPPNGTLYATSNTNRFNYFKIGQYRNPAITTASTMDVCSLRFGGTYASVDPAQDA